MNYKFNMKVKVVKEKGAFWTKMAPFFMSTRIHRLYSDGKGKYIAGPLRLFCQ